MDDKDKARNSVKFLDRGPLNSYIGRTGQFSADAVRLGAMLTITPTNAVSAISRDGRKRNG